MGCGSSSGAQVANTAPTSIPPAIEVVTDQKHNAGESKEQTPVQTPEAKTATFNQVHSIIRWGKPIADIAPVLALEGGPTVTDPQTGNFPIHIAAQNGHLEIVKYLVEVCKVDVNAANFQANTALHMAIEYDYLEVANFLLEHKASKSITNRSGKLSGKGIEGVKTVEILTLAKAETEKQLLEALELCDKTIAEIDKSTFIGTALKTKKAVGREWTDEVQIKFKAVLAKAV